MSAVDDLKRAVNWPVEAWDKFIDRDTTHELKITIVIECDRHELGFAWGELRSYFRHNVLARKLSLKKDREHIGEVAESDATYSLKIEVR